MCEREREGDREDSGTGKDAGCSVAAMQRIGVYVFCVSVLCVCVLHVCAHKLLHTKQTLKGIRAWRVLRFEASIALQSHFVYGVLLIDG